jgi:hypothetical protein
MYILLYVLNIASIRVVKYAKFKGHHATSEKFARKKLPKNVRSVTLLV